jgi:hypothetical protein
LGAAELKVMAPNTWRVHARNICSNKELNNNFVPADVMKQQHDRL